MLRGAPQLRRGALLIRSPRMSLPRVGPGSAVYRETTLHRVRDTHRLCAAGEQEGGNRD